MRKKIMRLKVVVKKNKEVFLIGEHSSTVLERGVKSPTKYKVTTSDLEWLRFNDVLEFNSILKSGDSVICTINYSLEGVL